MGAVQWPALALVGLIAFLPAIPYLFVAVSWVFGGLGMGLATSSSSLAVMSLSTAAEQGRNASSLNLYDALGSAIFVGIAGSIFAALHSTGNLALTFGLVELSMSTVALLAVTPRCVSVLCMSSLSCADRQCD